MSAGALHPLPAAMPWRAKADVMVRRGEARDFSDACRLLGGRRSFYGRTRLSPEDRAMLAQAEPPRARLPYRDD